MVPGLEGDTRPRADLWPMLPSVGFDPLRCAAALVAVFAVLPENLQRAHPLCRRNPRSRPIRSRKKQRRASLFFAVFGGHRNRLGFADLRTPSSSLARPQDIGPGSPPVFAENLQALTISFAITTPPLSKSSSCYMSFRRDAVIQSASCRCKLLQKYAIVNLKITPR